MILNRVKLGRAVTFMKYLASINSLTFLPKTLILTKMAFTISHSLTFSGLVANELQTRLSLNVFTNTHFLSNSSIIYAKILTL